MQDAAGGGGTADGPSPTVGVVFALFATYAEG